MSDGSEEYLSPLQRLNRLVTDRAYFERNTFDSDETFDVLTSIMVNYDLSDEHLEALQALTAALRGYHPLMALRAKAVPDGSVPRPLRERKRDSVAMTVADRIDMKVALGCKQESAIQEEIEAAGLSRREIFRLLKIAREERQKLKAIEHQLADWDRWYDGFDIADDGTLVPSA